jgi:hypothetical protein
MTQSHAVTPQIGRLFDLSTHSPPHLAIRDGRTVVILDRADPAFSASTLV